MATNERDEKAIPEAAYGDWSEYTAASFDDPDCECASLDNHMFCPIHGTHKKRRPEHLMKFYESPVPASQGEQVNKYDNTSTGWLIEKGGLCIGRCGQGYKWTVFTDSDALKFPTEVEAERYLYAMPNYPIGCEIREHMWVDDSPRLLREVEQLRTDFHREHEARVAASKDAAAMSLKGAAAESRAEAAESELTRLREALAEVSQIAEDSPELNMANYDEDQVSTLNEAMIAIVLKLRAALNTK